MKIHSAYRYELDLNNKQRSQCVQYAGVARWAYNYGLRRKIEAREKGEKMPSAIDLDKEVVRLKSSECPWLAEVSSTVPTQALRNLDRAFANFFAKRGRFPRFKSRKRGIGSFRLRGTGTPAPGRKVRLPRLGTLRTKEETKVQGRILSATVSETAGHWFVSFQVERDIVVPENQGPAVGVDLGVSQLATLSDGGVVENPRHFDRRLRQLRRLHRRLSRRQKGSGRYRVLKARIARLYYRIACARSDVTHKLTSRLAKGYGTVGVEDLNVLGLQAGNIARAISDAAFGEIRRQLAYKCQWYGSRLVVHDRFFPSSKTCSGCGAIKDDLPRGERTYRCEACGLVIDRDLNAAINLHPAGGRVLGVEGKALAPAQAGDETGPCEAPTGHCGTRRG